MKLVLNLLLFLLVAGVVLLGVFYPILFPR